MATFGMLNDLNLLRLAPEGAWLDGGPDGEILLPSGEAPGGSRPGEPLRVFIHSDEAGRLAATTKRPYLQRGEVAHLKIVSANKEGALLAWGLPKPLFLPWKEVKEDRRPLIQPGQKVLVILFRAEDGRLTASARLEEFLSDEAEGLREGEQVSLIIGDRTDLGVRVVVNHRFWGLVHDSDIFGPLTRGESREGYIKALRPDGKLNVALQAPGYAKVDASSQRVLEALKRGGGFLPVTDKSPPAAIHAQFGMSKKAFKLSLGALYKARRILIEAEGIRLLP